MPEKTCLVSIDVEEDFTESGQKNFLGVESLDDILGVFDRFGIKATLFVTGEVLENYASLARRWSEIHEIACHGYYHTRLSELPSAEREKQLADFSRLYHKIFGARPQGFRAREYIIDNEQIRLLAKFGFAYDSSVISGYPFLLKYDGYRGKAPAELYQPGYDNYRKSGEANIIEIPTIPLALGVPLHGTWLRMFGAGFYKTLLILKKPELITLMMHSWDCVKYRGKYSRNSGKNFPGLLERLLAALSQHYVFSNYSGFLNERHG